MVRFIRLMTLVLALGFVFSAAQAHAKKPTYLILRPPAKMETKHGYYHYYPAVKRSVARHTYAYGYFGAKPRRHWSKHHGYYRNFTQWSAR